MQLTFQSNTPLLSSTSRWWRCGIFCGSGDNGAQYEDESKRLKLREVSFRYSTHWPRNTNVNELRLSPHEITKLRNNVDRGKTKQLPIIYTARLEVCRGRNGYVILKTVKNHPHVRRAMRNEIDVHYEMELAGLPVTKLIGFYEDRDLACVVYEHVEKGDLFEKMQRVKNPSGSKWFNHAQRQLYLVGQAIAFMHSRGLVHKDLSLENILLDKNYKFLLHDFGEAERIKLRQPNYQSSLWAGKECYMGPENYDTSKGIRTGFDPRANDVWSFGVILLSCFSYGILWEQPNRRSQDFLSTMRRIKKELTRAFHLQSQPDPLVKFKLKQLVELLMLIFVREAKRLTMDEVLAHSFFSNCRRQRSPIKSYRAGIETPKESRIPPHLKISMSNMDTNKPSPSQSDLPLTPPSSRALRPFESDPAPQKHRIKAKTTPPDLNAMIPQNEEQKPSQDISTNETVFNTDDINDDVDDIDFQTVSPLATVADQNLTGNKNEETTVTDENLTNPTQISTMPNPTLLVPDQNLTLNTNPTQITTTTDQNLTSNVQSIQA